MDIAASKLQLAWWSYVSRQDQEFASQLIQKMWRGVLDRQKYDCLRQEYLAACLIQRTWRGYSQQITFLILVESTLLLQRVTRGFLSRKETSLQRSQSAAIFIQKLWRGFSQQVKYQIDIMDVICVQCLARRRLAQTLRNKMLRAALVLQCATRCAVARRKLAAAQGAMKIQTFWRSVKIQTRYRSMRQASMQIQRIWRGHSLRGEIWRQVFAATIIQSNWRCYWVLSDFEQYKVEKSATVLLQALVRRAIARRAFLECIFSATTIQRRWRRCLESTRYNAAATALQKAWRRYIQRVEFMSLRSSAIVIQCCFRVAQALEAAEFKRREKAATSLQRIWRGFFQQVQFQLEMMDIVCVQSQVRKYLARRRFLVIYHSTLRIQRCCRCAAARKHLALRRMERNTLLICSAITIQAILRSNALRLTYTTKRRASIAVQRFWRGYVIRCAMWNLTFAACQIQRNWRRYISRCSYLLQLLDIRSAILIQSVVRMHQTQVLLIRQKEASVKLQCLVRRRRSQRHLSMLIDMRRVLELRVKSALVIQTLVRGFMCRLQMARKADAATVIQSCWRCYEAQNNYLLDLLENKAAVVIQATFRMYLQRDDFMVTKYAAHTIQRCTRGLLARIDVAMKHFAATEIQRIWRGHSTYTLESIMNAVVKIQSLIRMAWAQRRFDELRILYWADLCFRQRKARQIQSAFREFQQRKRMHVAAEVIQSRFRFYSQLKRIQLLSIGMTMFQSLFRGWKARKMRNKKIARAAQRIREENNRAIHNPDLRLGNRTDRALYILQTSQSLTKIMDAVKELEASTRLSVVCCQVFTKANAANILLHLIQSCNRSVPHMELKEHILLTLENVSRYPSLVGSFAHYKYAEVFLDNIQVFRDKDGIFCLAISLLDRISSANPHVAQYCSSHEHLKRLREVFRVVSRRLDPRKASGVSDQRPSEDVLKKRVCFNRDYSIKLLGQMIDSFSDLEDLQIPERNRRSRFEF
jgi:abnormal spindle-like microcephaly-associated protein